MAWKWFVQSGEKIEGPFSTEDVQARMGAGHFNKQSLIWGPGVEAWQSMQAWTLNLSGMAPGGVGAEIVSEAWHYAHGGQSRGPMTREELIGQLKDISNGEIMLWTKGMKEWAPLYEFHDLLTEVGINKRQYPRADLTGKAVIKSSGNIMIAPLLSISEGGFGVGLDAGFVSGESVTVELQSSSFRDPLQAKAEVRYVGQGVIGFKFSQINVETRGLIIQFIKQNQVRFTIKAA
jgi:hypothetical protein